MSFLGANKGKSMQAIVEKVCNDGSSLCVYLLPEFQFVQVYVAGIAVPSNGRRTTQAKHFTEMRVLNRDVRIVLEGVDEFDKMICSVYYSDGESEKDLAIELIKNGYAKYVEGSAIMLEEEARRKLKAAALEEKNSRTNTTPISHNFTGEVVEVISGNCVIVADDSMPYGSPAAERQVNLSSIRSPIFSDIYARDAREFFRTRLIGRQVQVSMEYSKKVKDPSGPVIMCFGSVFLLSQPKENNEDVLPVTSNTQHQQPGVNIAELIIARGFGIVNPRIDDEERSHYFENLLAAESRAKADRKGLHSGQDPPPSTHVTDLSATTAKIVLDFFKRNMRTKAVVEYVHSGHIYELFLPEVSCSIVFSISGVRCPVLDEPYSNEAISLMRRKIMQRDVEIEVETVDTTTGTFIGTLWESKINVGVTLLESGLSKLQTGSGADRIPYAHLLAQAEQFAKKQKLKLWENYVEGEEV